MNTAKMILIFITRSCVETVELHLYIVINKYPCRNLFLLLKSIDNNIQNGLHETNSMPASEETG